MSDDEFEALLLNGTMGRRPAGVLARRCLQPSSPAGGGGLVRARAYCAWLSAQTGETFRLPTEAEWEAAARGVQCRRYAFGDDFDAARCNTFETHVRHTTPIGVFAQDARRLWIHDWEYLGLDQQSVYPLFL